MKKSFETLVVDDIIKHLEKDLFLTQQDFLKIYKRRRNGVRMV